MARSLVSLPCPLVARSLVSLPCPLLARILQLLPLEDRRQAVLVCVHMARYATALRCTVTNCKGLAIAKYQELK